MKKLSFWLKLSLSLIALIVLFRGIDYGQVLSTVGGGKVWLFAIAFLLTCTTNIVQVIRWRYLMTAPDADYRSTSSPLGFLVFLRYHLIANFFQLFLPSSASGDVVKAYYSLRDKGLGSLSLASIIIGRLLGVVAVILLGLGVVIILPDQSLRARILSDKMVWAIAAGAVFLCIVVVNANRLKIGSLWPDAPRFIGRIINLSERLLLSLGHFRKRPTVLAVGLLLSTMIHVLIVATSYCIFTGLGWKVSLGIFAVYVPIISLLTMLPVSFNGIGIREVLFSYFLGPFGCTPELVLSYAVIGYLFIFLIGIAGWGCYLSTPLPPRTNATPNNTLSTHDTK